MTAILLGIIAFVCLMVGTTAGMLIRSRLPEHHLSSDSRDTVKLGAGLIATLSALVLGLLVSSAKESFDSMNTAITQSSAKLIMLDRSLALYGPETNQIREQIRDTITKYIKVIWHEANGKEMEAFENSPPLMEVIGSKLRELKPENDVQKAYLSDAIQICRDMLQTRWLVIEQSQASLPPAFIVILLFWLTVLFTSFGLLAPTNKTVFVVLVVCAMSVGGAIFLIEEMNKPMTGLLKISKAPLVKAVEHMGK